MGRVYDALPEESRTARVQLLLPRHSPAAASACVLHLAATGDQAFRSRYDKQSFANVAQLCSTLQSLATS